jgi:hypothetical protein
MCRVDILVGVLFGGAARVPPRRRALRRHEFLMRQAIRAVTCSSPPAAVSS